MQENTNDINAILEQKLIELLANFCVDETLNNIERINAPGAKIISISDKQNIKIK